MIRSRKIIQRFGPKRVFEAEIAFVQGRESLNLRVGVWQRRWFSGSATILPRRFETAQKSCPRFTDTGSSVNSWSRPKVVTSFRSGPAHPIRFLCIDAPEQSADSLPHCGDDVRCRSRARAQLRPQKRLAAAVIRRNRRNRHARLRQILNRRLMPDVQIRAVCGQAAGKREFRRINLADSLAEHGPASWGTEECAREAHQIAAGRRAARQNRNPAGTSAAADCPPNRA